MRLLERAAHAARRDAHPVHALDLAPARQRIALHESVDLRLQIGAEMLDRGRSAPEPGCASARAGREPGRPSAARRCASRPPRAAGARGVRSAGRSRRAAARSRPRRTRGTIRLPWSTRTLSCTTSAAPSPLPVTRTARRSVWSSATGCSALPRRYAVRSRVTSSGIADSSASQAISRRSPSLGSLSCQKSRLALRAAAERHAVTGQAMVGACRGRSRAGPGLDVDGERRQYEAGADGELELVFQRLFHVVLNLRGAARVRHSTVKVW